MNGMYDAVYWQRSCKIKHLMKTGANHNYEFCELAKALSVEHQMNNEPDGCSAAHQNPKSACLYTNKRERNCSFMHSHIRVQSHIINNRIVMFMNMFSIHLLCSILQSSLYGWSYCVKMKTATTTTLARSRSHAVNFHQRA